jgi:ATP adenylyltransferase
MIDKGKPSASQSRFDWVVQGATRGPDGVFDEDLAEFPYAAVIPTKGAFVAEWLLVVPRIRSLSVADLDQTQRTRVLAVAETVSACMSARVGACVLFEHGPRQRESATGCGVDQAHLHVVGGAPDLLDRLIEQVDDANWSTANYADPWQGTPPDCEYLMVRNSSTAVRALVSSATSQRLRRALADVLGCGEEWDYRSHPHEWNARRTKEMFQGAFANAPA